MARSIQPIKAFFSDPANVTSLEVSIIRDDLSSICNLWWGLFSDDGVKRAEGNLVISGADYLGWSGNNDFPYTYTAQSLGITLIPLS